MSFGFSVGDFLAVGQIAWNVYVAVKGASAEFRSLEHVTLSIHAAIKQVEKELADQNSLLYRKSIEDAATLAQLTLSCRTELENLDGLVTKYKSLSSTKKKVWDRMRFAGQNLEDIRSKLNAHLTTIDVFCSSVQLSSLSRIEQKLEELAEEIRSGRKEPSLLSVASVDQGYLWKELKSELAEEGISAADLEDHKELIKEYILKLVRSGDLAAEGIDDLASIGSNESPSVIAVIREEGVTAQASSRNPSPLLRNSTPLPRTSSPPPQIELSTLPPEAKSFLLELEEIEALCQANRHREASKLGIEFLQNRFVDLTTRQWNNIEKNILLSHGKGYIGSGYGFTVLHLVSAYGTEAVVQLLLDKGANLEAEDQSGWTALQWASSKGRETISKLLAARSTTSEAEATQLLAIVRESHPAAPAAAPYTLQLSNLAIGSAPSQPQANPRYMTQGYPPAPPQSHYAITSQIVNSTPSSKANLIVGVDLGITFSSVAWAFATNTEAKEDIITEWPGAGSLTKQKIPTTLYYDETQKIVGWGPDISEVMVGFGITKPGVRKLEYFLLLVGEESRHDLPPLPPGLSAVEVLASYLYRLRMATRTALQKSLGEVFLREERNIQYVFTHLNAWSDTKKELLKEAIIQAGFLRDKNDPRLRFLSVGEAAAFYTCKTGLLNPKVSEAFLVANCGESTVDLMAYELEDDIPTSFAELTTGTGDTCGYTAVRQNFSGMVRYRVRKMGLPDSSKTAGRVYAKCILDFENRIRGDFSGNGQLWAIDVGVETEFPAAGIEEGYMTFRDADIAACFAPVVDRILELVSNQITAVSAIGKQTKIILLLGAFSTSEYLFQQIKTRVPAQLQHAVVRPMDWTAAVVKGAVSAGITERVVAHRIARRHYLIEKPRWFVEYQDPEPYRMKLLTGPDQCRYASHALVHRGQKVKYWEPLKYDFQILFDEQSVVPATFTLYGYYKEDLPRYIVDPGVEKIMTATLDFGDPYSTWSWRQQPLYTNEGVRYRIDLSMYLTLEGPDYVLELVCEGVVCGRARSKFR